MFKIFFFKEITSGLKRPMVYIFLLIFTIIAAVAVASDEIAIGGSIGNVYKNAPHVLATYSAFLSIFGLLIATAYFNNAALRDFHAGFNEILFSSPITRAGYFFGRFFGALILSTIPLLGIFIGFIVGTKIGLDAGSITANRIGDFYFASFINSYLLFILPNMFIAGAIIFALATRWKNTLVSFLATMAIILSYLASGVLMTDIDQESMAAMVDIFGIRAYQIDARYFTALQKNTLSVGFSGLLLVNRIIWMIVSSVVITIAYRVFSFQSKNNKLKKETVRTSKVVPIFNKPTVASIYNLKTTIIQFLSFFKINFYGILRSTSFKILLLFGVIILIANVMNGFEYFGLQSYPITYKLLQYVQAIGTVMGMIMLVFYSGELVWKDRASKISGVIDATPHYSLVILLAKTVSLIAIAVFFHLSLILASVGYQLFNGYLRIEIHVYMQDFIYAVLPQFIIWSCLLIFIQIAFNHKYLGYFVSVVILFLTELLIEVLGVSTFLVNIGIAPQYIYSDMNGFSAGIVATIWYNIYWLLFGFFFLTIAGLIMIRGNISGIYNRWKTMIKQLNKPYLFMIFLLAVLFLVTGSFVFYNTEILNAYESKDELKLSRVNYEKRFKKYSKVKQPKILAIQYHVDIFPEERRVSARSVLQLVNQTNHHIDSLHFTLINEVRDATKALAKWNKDLIIPNSELLLYDEQTGYQIHQLQAPLKPGDTLIIEALAQYAGQGFENKVSNLRVAENGTFIDFISILPGLGYLSKNELSDPNDRLKYGLQPKKEILSLEIDCLENCLENYVSLGESDWVSAETIISTSNDQIAIAPGSLIKEWSQNGRRYFHYKTDHRSLNYFNFMSARYEVARKKWNEVDIEVYYDQKHEFNVEKILSAVERSLQYYTDNFGPYYHKQARVIEFPGYFTFAEAFPGTMPYSESYGFTTNLENADDNNVIDAVVAHEMAHQWWAHQVIGANVQGVTMLSESLSEYSALMVMKNALKDDLKMKEFLKYDIDRYLKGRSAETQQEMPLYKVGDQGYVHYGKGSVILYALQDYIGEEKVNAALKEFLEKFKYKTPYPTSLDFIGILQKQIPDSLNYLVNDWFREITLYDYRLNKTNYVQKGTGKYHVEIGVEAYKLRVNETGVEVAVPLNDWVDIGLYADETESDLRYCKKVFFDQAQMSFNLEVDFIPTKAVIDPKRLLIEKIVSDNEKKVAEKIE